MVDSYGDRLKKAMKDAGFSTPALAEKMGVSFQAVRKAEKGLTKSFSAKNNEKAAELLGVRAKWLATGDLPMRAAAESAVAGATNVTQFAPPKDACPLPKGIRDKLVNVDPRLIGRVEQAVIDAIKEWEQTEGDPGKKSVAGGGHRPKRVPRRPSH